MKERNVVLQGQEDGQKTMDYPITRLSNIVDDVEVKAAAGEGDYIPVVDGDDGGQMKKIPAAALRVSAHNPAEEIIVPGDYGVDFTEAIMAGISGNGASMAALDADALIIKIGLTVDSGRVPLLDILFSGTHFVIPVSIIANSEGQIIGVFFSMAGAVETEWLALSFAVSSGITIVHNDMTGGGGITQEELQTALSKKADAATAATKAELNTAKTALETAIGKKADAATAVTKSELQAALSSKADGITWTVATLPISSLSSVTYGGGKFVAVSYDSYKTAYSEDGVTWTEAFLPSSGWRSVTYGNGKFVAVGNSNEAAYSEDGITWTVATLPISSLSSVTYGNGKFVAIENNSDKAAYSEDGITWTEATLPSSSTWHSVTYGGGKFVAVAYRSYKAAYSEDGITWAAATLPSSNSWRSVTYGGGKFVAVAQDSDKAAYSEDGITWTAATLPFSASWNSVTYGDGKFVAVAQDSDKAAYSEDGITWAAATLPSSNSWRSVTYGDGKFVAVTSREGQAAISTKLVTAAEMERTISEAIQAAISGAIEEAY